MQLGSVEIDRHLVSGHSSLQKYAETAMPLLVWHLHVGCLLPCCVQEDRRHGLRERRKRVIHDPLDRARIVSFETKNHPGLDWDGARTASTAARRMCLEYVVRHVRNRTVWSDVDSTSPQAYPGPIPVSDRSASSTVPVQQTPVTPFCGSAGASSHLHATRQFRAPPTTTHHRPGRTLSSTHRFPPVHDG